MTDTAPKTNDREVLAVFVTYRKVKTDILGNERVAPATGVRGQTISLFPDDEKRLEAYGALVPKGQVNAQQIVDDQMARTLSPFDLTEGRPLGFHALASPPGGGADPRVLAGGVDTVVVAGGAGDLSTGQVPEDVSGALDTGDSGTVAEYIQAEKPNAADTVALAGNDPAKAQTVLDAEHAAQSGDGRTTVVEPLQKIIDQG